LSFHFVKIRKEKTVNQIKLILGAFTLFLLYFFSSCEKEIFITDSTAELNFSTDTVFFDTIFTTIGSTTKRFTVHNPHSKKIKVSSIKLAGGNNSVYRLNINGQQSNSLSDVEIPANDSLFIFVEVTIDPNNTNNPLVAKDSVVFSTNGNTQDVKLVSWGQDVHLIDGEVLNTQTWIADKPYLVYNSALVDTNQTLTIEAGAKVHFHRNSRFYIAGSLQCNGTKENPIVFQADRLEDDYSDIPGQWDGIWLMPGSKANVMDFCHIKNAIIGIQVDTLGSLTEPTLTLSNSKIEHMSYAGIYAQGATIKAHNSVISDCGSFALALTLGGEYEFYHCTVGNYWNGMTRNTPSVFLNNYYIDVYENTQVRDLEALFANSIVYGNLKNEIGFDYNTDGTFNYSFKNSLIKTNPDTDTSTTNYEEVIINENPRFIDAYNYNYQLDTLSPAIDEGDQGIGNLYPTDILNNNRTNDEGPDLGAYERIPGNN
jgi:hypothetical protein